jgi:uncharacterized protein YcfJ
MNKLIVAGVLTLMSTSAMAETVTDHFKSIIEQTPYRVEVCKDVVIQGKTDQGGAIIGGLIGGVIGNQFGKGGGKAAATGIGAMTGAILGGNNNKTTPSTTQRQCQIETRYEETAREVYSHSIVTFMYNGKQQVLRFTK